MEAKVGSKAPNKELVLRSDEVQEILSDLPNWVIRWGVTVLLGLLLLAVFISWFIRYPDVVSGEVLLTTEQAPTRLISQTNGYLQNLSVSNDRDVEQGELIAEIRSPIQKSSIDQLFASLTEQDPQAMIAQLQSLQELGSVQNEVNALIQALVEYHNLTNNDYFENSLGHLSDQIVYTDKLAKITLQELHLMHTELVNAKDKFEADSTLYAQKIIAKHTFYANQSDFFIKKQQLINAEKAHVQHQIAAVNFRKQQSELKKSYQTQKLQLETAIAAAKQSIHSAISNWQQSFVLTAPYAGRLNYLSHLSAQQYVKTGQALFAIIPKEENIVGVLKISNQAFGKVELKQQVRMKFSNYPYQEYGQLIGEVTKVSKIPSEDGYLVHLVLTNGMTTSYQKTIQYKPEMAGTAEVITQNHRLLERVFNNLRELLDH